MKWYIGIEEMTSAEQDQDWYEKYPGIEINSADNNYDTILKFNNIAIFLEFVENELR